MTGFRIRQLHRFGTSLYLINKKNKLKRLANVGQWTYNKSNSQMPFKL